MNVTPSRRGTLVGQIVNTVPSTTIGVPSLSVPRSLDAGEVRAMLNEVANAHGDVMQKPPPAILFKKIGTATMDFDLVCVVADVDIVGRVTSDLNFAIHKRLTEMEPAAGTPELLVKGLEGVEQSLGSIAAAVTREAASPPRLPPEAKPAPARSRRRPGPPLEEEESEAAPAPPPPAPPEPAKDDSKE